MGNKPRIRFKGFTEDWEQRKLGSIGSTYTGLSGKTKEDFGHGEAQYITYLNVFQNTISDITMTDKVEIDITQNEVKYGDVLFTTSSETPEEVGMSSVWLGDTPNIYLNSFCFGFRPNQKIDPYFLGYSLRAPYMRDKIKILAQGISRYNISKNKVMELEISLPNNEEQKLLGTFLQRIDLIITLHQCKLEKLKLMKKALLQKLFPKNGKHIPEIRFKGFTDAWEQRKLGECMNSFAYGLNAAAKEYDGMHKYIRITDIDDETHNFIQSNLTSPDIDFNTDVSDYKLNVGDIVFARTGASVGKTYLYNPNDGDLYYAGFLIRGKVKDDYDAGFIYQNTLTKDYDAFIKITSQRSGQPGVNSKEYATFRLNIPCKDEQRKISKVLNSLDELFTLHQRKLERLQEVKKDLLQKMFV
ncbi:type I restriction modification DNA specificity domain protein [Veillonella atypica ACS-049-V-Sch6]|uniref:Type I restriction modification DNA specificity domain protein n=1 Tax=Veillonella atypica ACS-049-V-Sch6 TaxID=866776 RepID=E1L576_9FIRM|nr:restriction endonuclease subunit S [Veillonella atypica]EFL56597.1 type I restriction modification DNA specificity domain protein [Veillonella atypica ACS-049-V-Sch6]